MSGLLEVDLTEDVHRRVLYDRHDAVMRDRDWLYDGHDEYQPYVSDDEVAESLGPIPADHWWSVFRRTAEARSRGIPHAAGAWTADGIFDLKAGDGTVVARFVCANPPEETE